MVVLGAYLSFLFVTNDAFSNSERNIFEAINNDRHHEHAMQLKVVPIYYADVEEIYKFLINKKYSFLSNLGVLNVNKRLRQLWVKDDAEHIEKITAIVKKLDLPAKQVLIKARIVNIDTHSLRELGVSFSTHTIDKTRDGFIMDLPHATSNEIMMPLVKLKANALIDLKLSALEQTGHAQILAKPELTTINRKTAFIQSGEEVPYEEKTQSGGTSITFKKAALQLQVTPEILPNNKILLKLSVNQDKISTINVAGAPAIHTQKIKTQVLVNNQQTIALGGIFEEMRDRNQKRTPILSKIPILGFLFRHRFHAFEHKELIIFVTPSILLSA